MWFQLGHHKIKFNPGMVGYFFEMTLMPDTDFDTATIPIIFDIIQCEFYSGSGSNRPIIHASRTSLLSLSSEGECGG